MYDTTYRVPTVKLLVIDDLPNIFANKFTLKVNRDTRLSNGSRYSHSRH